MAKQLAESSNRLSIFWLNKQGYLNRDYSQHGGGIKWTYGWNDSESSISFFVTRDNWGTPMEKTYIELKYIHTDRSDDKKDHIVSRVDLIETPCNYGGKRYWFICPLYKSGIYCGRRVGVLFSIGKWFGCRHCGEIAYAKQMEGGKFRWNGVSIKDIERAEEEVKRPYYRGKPTRKYRRVIRLNEKFEDGWLRMMTKLK